MVTVNVHEAKTHLSRLLAQVEAGEEVIISRAGKPIAKLSRLDPTPKKRVLGQDRGLVVIGDDWDAPLPADMAAAFGTDLK
jgi:antitoxin (DNA-binding transcriptional repressor) of toxin-antitoxin stability system